MAFQLFNVNSNFGNNLQQGIESLGQGINKGVELGEQYKTDSKALDTLAKSHPDLFPGYDEHGMSAVQKSRMFRGYVQNAQVGMQLAQTQAQQAEAAKNQAITAGINQSTTMTADEWQRQKEQGNAPLMNTSLGQQLASQGGEVGKLKQDISGLGLDNDYNQFKSAYLTANKYQARAADAAKKQSENQSYWKEMSDVTKGGPLMAGIANVGGGLGKAGGAISKIWSGGSGALEMNDEEKQALVKLHQVNMNPTKAQAFMQLYRSEQAGVPDVQSPISTPEMVVKSMRVGGRNGATMTMGPAKK